MDVIGRAYRMMWRAITVPLLVWRIKLAYRVWGGDEAAYLIAHARKHAIVPLLRALGATIAEDADIEPHLIIHNAHNGLHNLFVGPGCHIGKASFMDFADTITLTNCCTLSMGVTLLTHTDVGRTPLRDGPYPLKTGSVTIGEGAYVGANATILRGVRIGRCAVVAAGAVVREDVPDYTVVGGVPAHIIKHIDPTEIPTESMLLALPAATSDKQSLRPMD